MDSLVPSYLSLGGVDFPLEVHGASVGLASRLPELEPLRYALDEVVNGDLKDVDAAILRQEGFAVQGVSMRPVLPGRELADGPISWRRLSGAWPDLQDAFLIRVTFLATDLVLPRSVLFELIERLRTIRLEILAGARADRLDGSEVPPPRPLTPELEEYLRLREEWPERAESYRQELYARRR